MKTYLWRFTAGDGMDVIALLKDVLDPLRGRRDRQQAGVRQSPGKTSPPSATPG